MIYTKRLITIRNTTASIDAPVVLYRGDKEVEIIFEIIDSKFKFESSSGNLIDNSHAAYTKQLLVEAKLREFVSKAITVSEEGEA